MNERSALVNFRRLAALSSFALIFVVAPAHAQRAIMTTHVPDEVANRVAPLIGRLPAEGHLSLAISLPLRNQAQLDDLLVQLYDRQSPLYHKYLSVQEFADRFGPTEADFQAVQRFAEASGLTVVDRPANRMVLDIDGPAARIESAFHVTLETFQHPTEARTFYAPDREPTVDLDVPLLHISGLDNFDLPQPKNIMGVRSLGEAGGSGPNGSFLGSDLRAAYYGSGSLNGAGQSVGIFSLGGYQLSDITTYFNNANEPLTVPIVNVAINGAKTTCPPASCNDGEEALDIEMAISMAPGLKQLMVYIGKSNVSVFNQMAADNIAKQLSCSWGWKANQSSLDPIFEEMEAQGQTVFVASGDQGSSTAANIVWPADDAYVISVGGTDLTTKSPGGAWKSETGWKNSAGMPSKNNIAIPSYQQLAGVITSANHGSKTLRNLPDVAMESNAVQYVCYNSVCRTFGGGTSYASPLWAGFIALVNQQAVSNGNATVGFINPALYAIGTGSSFSSDMHDITSGSNGGYSAVAGFDLVTGWGSPNGANFVNALAAQ